MHASLQHLRLEPVDTGGNTTILMEETEASEQVEVAHRSIKRSWNI